MNDDFGLLNDKEQAFVNAYNEKIRNQERDRIIALIESSEVGGYQDAEYLVALIKGENND